MAELMNGRVLDRTAFESGADLRLCFADVDSERGKQILETQKGDGVDLVNQPPHYMAHEMECIDEIEVVFGGLGAYYFCVGNVWKYRYRADHKGNPEQDAKKSDWYMKKAKEIKDRYDLDIKVS